MWATISYFGTIVVTATFLIAGIVALWVVRKPLAVAIPLVAGLYGGLLGFMVVAIAGVVVVSDAHVCDFGSCVCCDDLLKRVVPVHAIRWLPVGDRYWWANYYVFHWTFSVFVIIFIQFVLFRKYCS